MAEIRAAIAAGTFAELYAARRATLALEDPDNPPGRPPTARPSKPSTRGAFAVQV